MRHWKCASATIDWPECVEGRTGALRAFDDDGTTASLDYAVHNRHLEAPAFSGWLSGKKGLEKSRAWRSIDAAAVVKRKPAEAGYLLKSTSCSIYGFDKYRSTIT